MRFSLFGSLLLVFGATIAQPNTPPSEFRVRCDAQCLSQFAERYLDALIHRQASRVPLAASIRFTENGSELAIGDGLWATAEGLAGNQLIFTDPESGGIQLYAGIVEAGLPSMLAACLKVADRHVTEIETSGLRRNADDPAMAAFAVDRPIWQETVPVNRRSRRLLHSAKFNG